ncbi:TlpA disulfide reductase family protein [Pedobacter sp. P351]|uniref:TlpA family protein disulfide reductase n=1 Tax=Pedobacter superstes TaxID=3133441 RepID=UPI00309F7998
MKFIKSNSGFIFLLLCLGVITFNPKARSLFLGGLIKTGLYEPDIEKNNIESNYPMAPQARFISASGDQTDISKLKNKVIFLNFWATWCPPCIAEMPSVNSLKTKFGANKSIVFLMVDVDSKLKDAELFLKKNKYNLTAFAQDSPVPEALFKGTVPTTVIINKKGEIVFYHEGMADYNSAEMQNFISGLLK